MSWLWASKTQVVVCDKCDAVYLSPDLTRLAAWCGRLVHHDHIRPVLTPHHCTGPPPARTGLVRLVPCSGETNPTVLLNYVWIINVSQLSLHSLLAGHRIHTKSSWFGGTAPAPASLYSSITNHANQNNKKEWAFHYYYEMKCWMMLFETEAGVDGILDGM